MGATTTGMLFVSRNRWRVSVHVWMIEGQEETHRNSFEHFRETLSQHGVADMSGQQISHVQLALLLALGGACHCGERVGHGSDNAHGGTESCHAWDLL